MPSRPAAARTIQASIALIALMIIAGCGGQDETSTSPQTPQVTPFSGEVPSFDGPYAAEFSEFYQKATSDFVRGVLEDEQITDAEYTEMKARFSSCLADQGITLKEMSPTGGISTSLAPGGGDTNAIVGDCSTEAGEDLIGALYGFVTANPENLDTATILAQCLAATGLVPSDYSAADYSADSVGRFADFESLSSDLQDALVECSTDPLGLVGSK